jgi:hypothetical protein
MKKALLLFTIAAIFLSSCKKDRSATKPAVTKYKVTFNVNNFLGKQSAFALRRPAGPSSTDALPSLNTYFDVLYYIVWNTERSAIEEVVQDSTMSNMGTITDALPAGDYRISIVAGKNGLVVDPNYFGANDFGYGGNSWQDTFFASFQVTVGPGGINQGVTLNRVVGKLEVTLLDKIPANAANLTISTNQEAYGLDLWQGFYFFGPLEGVSFTVAIPDSAKGKPNFTIDRLIGNCSGDGFPLNIVCTAADNSVIASASVPTVYCQANQKTTVSGNLFGALATSNSQQQFTTVIDTAWGNATTQANFRLKTKRSGTH